MYCDACGRRVIEAKLRYLFGPIPQREPSNRMVLERERRSVVAEKRSAVLAVFSDIARRGLRSMLAEAPELGVRGEIASVEQANLLATEGVAEPDVLLAVLEPHRWDAEVVLATIRQEIWPTTRLVVIAMRYDVDRISALAELDLSGLLLWDDVTAAGLGHCLAAMLESSLVVTSQAVARTYIDVTIPLTVSRDQKIYITDRELETLRFLARGCTQREIALQTGRSFRSVSRITRRLKKKLNASSSCALGAAGARLGLLESSE